MNGAFQTGAFQPAYQQEEEGVSSGGWWYAYEYIRNERERELARRRRRKKELEEIEAQEAIAADIARLLEEQEAKDAERKELQRLQALADSYSGKRIGLPKPVASALINAYEARTRNALQQLQREIDRAMEEEEMAMVMLLLSDD